MTKDKSLDQEFAEVYEKGGAEAVYALANTLGIEEWKDCKLCEAETPRHPKDHSCLVCGQ